MKGKKLVILAIKPDQCTESLIYVTAIPRTYLQIIKCLINVTKSDIYLPNRSE